jgi:hypothetical protein
MISSLPAIFFFVAIFFLNYSPLTLSGIISIQNKIFITFYQGLKSGFVPAMVVAINYVWNNFLWIVFLFFILTCFGFISLIFFHSQIDTRVLIITQLIFLILVCILTNFSPMLIVIAFSLSIGVLWEKKTFEPSKDDFTNAYNVINARLWLTGIFVCIGIFLILYMNFQVYEQEIIRSNKELMMSLLPNFEEIKEGQKREIIEITEGFKSTLTGVYNSKNESIKKECKSIYEDMNQAFDSYKNKIIQKIEGQEFGISEEDLSKQFPFFGVMSQITPLLMTLSGFAFFTVFNPIIGFFFGMFYSLMKKLKKS